MLFCILPHCVPMKTSRRFPLAYGTQCSIRQLYKAVKYESDYQIVYSLLLFSCFPLSLNPWESLIYIFSSQLKKKKIESICGASGLSDTRTVLLLCGCFSNLQKNANFRKQALGMKAQMVLTFEFLPCVICWGFAVQGPPGHGGFL